MLFHMQLLLVTACSPEENRPEESHIADWPLYSRDYSNQRLSPLEQINLENINQLKFAWHYQADYGVNAPPVSYAINASLLPLVVIKYSAIKRVMKYLIFVLDD